jgi:ABC-2 type transport system ATP-binding protein
MPDAIHTSGLTKYYGPVVGVEGLTLAVPEGSIFGFLGPNGAGKTTAIRLLLDLLRPSSGSASIGGFDCHAESLRARQLVGYLPGELPVYPDLTGHGFLRFLGRIGGRPVVAATLARLLRRFDVSDTDLRRPMRDYSQGMTRKLGLLQALMTEPPVVVLDEPTAGLDPLMIEAFDETLGELKARGATVFLSSHVLSEVERTCDAIALLRRGRLVAHGGVAEIRREMPRRVVVSFSAPVDGAVPAGEGIAVVRRDATAWVLDVRGPLGPLVHSLGGLPVLDVRVEPFALEQYVLRFYSGEEAP